MSNSNGPVYSDGPCRAAHRAKVGIKLAIVDEVLAAYSDCNHHKGPRNLNYFCKHALTATELTKLMSSAVPDGYNGFDPAVSLVKIIETFGDDADYYVARESSVCVYIRPKHNIWLSRDTAFRSLADEVLFCPKHSMFRVWWD